MRLFTMARHFGQHDTGDAKQGFELSPSESTPFEGEFIYSGRYFGGCSRSKYIACADILLFCTCARMWNGTPPMYYPPMLFW